MSLYNVIEEKVNSLISFKTNAKFEKMLVFEKTNQHFRIKSEPYSFLPPFVRFIK